MESANDHSIPHVYRSAAITKKQIQLIGLKLPAANHIAAISRANRPSNEPLSIKSDAQPTETCPTISTSKHQTPGKTIISRTLVRHCRKNAALVLLIVSLVMMLCVVAQAAYLFGRSVSDSQYPSSTYLLDLSNNQDNASRKAEVARLKENLIREVTKIISRQHRLAGDLAALTDFVDRSPHIANSFNHTSFDLLDVLKRVSTVDSEILRHLSEIASESTEMKDPTKRCRGSRMLLVGHRCYYVSEMKLSWTDAHEFCEGLGGGLATVYNRKDNLQIFNAFNTTFGLGQGDAWIGLHIDPSTINDIYGCSENTTWKWVTGNGNQSYRNWNSGEPNTCVQPKHRKSETCVTFLPGKYGQWNDYICDKSLRFVCEL